MSALLAEFTLDPAWPWSLPGMGLPAVLVAGLVLAALTVWTYLGVRGAGWRRVLAVLALRLLALAVAFLVVLRPSFADREQAVIPSKLLILLDASGSMNISDESGGQSRWDAARRILKAPAVERLLRRLQNEQKVEIVYYRGAADVRKFDPNGKADGKRTDVGQWLHDLLKTHGGEQNLRGLVLLTDGADNGTRYPAMQEAARWRGVPCPIYTFALGSPTTSPRQRDIAVTAVHPDPPLVPVKTKLTVKATINAPGLEGQVVKAHLLIDGKRVASTQTQLRKTQGNEVVVGEYRPEKVGEVKVTVKVDRVEDEITEANNEMSTYVTVTNEGVRVLWVEGKKRAYEPILAIREALARDKRFEVSYTERHGDEREAGREDWFNFKKEHYDVIVIGDISAKQFSGGDPRVFQQIQEMVKERGTGLLMLGGYDTFANKDWPGAKAIADMLPVELNGRDAGQIDRRVRVLPRPAGLEYVLRVSEGDPNQIWSGDDPNRGFRPLDGMTRIGKVRPGSEVFADAEDTDGKKMPIIAARTFGAGRTLVFGGDTTWKAWRRNEAAIKAYERFWKQVVLWLAKREDASGNTYVMIDSNTRRVAAGGNKAVGFTVGVRGKGGLPVPDAKFLVKVIGPNKEETAVQTVREDKQERGYFFRTNEPGEYVVWARASGKDADGSPLDDRPATAKFLVYAEDLESLRPAADHDFLKNLAAAGGGTAYVGGEDRMTDFLERLLAEPLLPSRARAELWPDWRRTPVGDTAGEQLAALWTSGLLLTFVLFVTLLSLEWFLRRRWGMV